MTSSTLIIAEAGVNHDGNINKAFKLVDAAIFAKADIVKFQLFSAENIVSADVDMANYQKANSADFNSQLQLLKSLELSKSDILSLHRYALSNDIQILFSCFDEKDLPFLQTINSGLWKIPSGEITNLFLLKELSATRDNIILSTGMSSLGEIEFAVNTLISNGLNRQQLTLLQCCTDYPAPYSSTNLHAMVNIGNMFNTNFGFSDHTLGIEASLAAVALGASVIEKHLTLNCSDSGPDHKASLEPQDFLQLTNGIRRVEQCLGLGIKLTSQTEFDNKSLVRKKIFVSRPVKAGSIFKASDFELKRSSVGYSPLYLTSLIGTVACKDYSIGDIVDQPFIPLV